MGTHGSSSGSRRKKSRRRNDGSDDSDTPASSPDRSSSKRKERSHRSRRRSSSRHLDDSDSSGESDGGGKKRSSRKVTEEEIADYLAKKAQKKVYILFWFSISRVLFFYSLISWRDFILFWLFRRCELLRSWSFRRFQDIPMIQILLAIPISMKSKLLLCGLACSFLIQFRVFFFSYFGSYNFLQSWMFD